MNRSSHQFRFQLEALEPRILLSGDGLSGALLASTNLASAVEVLQTNDASSASTGQAFNQLLSPDVAQNPQSAAAQIESIFGVAEDPVSTGLAESGPTQESEQSVAIETSANGTLSAESASAYDPANLLGQGTSELTVTVEVPDERIPARRRCRRSPSPAPLPRYLPAASASLARADRSSG